VDHLNLKLYEEADLTLKTATMNLDPKRNNNTSRPSMFEPPTVAMHRSTVAEREMERANLSRRASSLKIKEAVKDVEDGKDMIIGALLVIAFYLGVTYLVFSKLLEEKVRKGKEGNDERRERPRILLTPSMVVAPRLC
jgi:hypothetical protein